MSSFFMRAYVVTSFELPNGGGTSEGLQHVFVELLKTITELFVVLLIWSLSYSLEIHSQSSGH